MSPVVLVCLVVSHVHHHGVQSVALLLHGHFLVYAIDPCFTNRQVGLDLPALSHQTGRHHLKLQLGHQPRYGHSYLQRHHLNFHLAELLKVSQTFQFC